jgi:hypothetical protein
MSKMNPEVKARWVAALRSGEYKQAKNSLRKQDAFCCLGVLCDLYDSSQWHGVAYGEEHKTGLPTLEVMTWAEFEPYSNSRTLFKTPKVVISGETLDLDEHNDKGRSRPRASAAEPLPPRAVVRDVLWRCHRPFHGLYLMSDYDEIAAWYEDMLSSLVTVIKWGLPCCVLLLAVAL